jgi:P27 family predicted phage terminase small subunit
MGKRGPRPAPLALRFARGDSPYRLNLDAPQAPAGIPAVPAVVAHNAVALEEWKRVLPLIHELGILSSVDGAALGLYCVAHAHWIEAEEKLRERGYVEKTPNGYLVQSPYMSISKSSIETARRLLCEFGLTPGSRGTLKASTPHDELQEFVESRTKGRRPQERPREPYKTSKKLR